MRSDCRREQPKDVTDEAQAGSDSAANARLGAWSQDRMLATARQLKSREFGCLDLLRTTGGEQERYDPFAPAQQMGLHRVR